MEEKTKTGEAYQRMMITWFSILVSQFLFLVLVYLIKPEILDFDFSKPILDENSVVVIALGAVSISSFALSFFVRKKLLDKAIAEQNINAVQTAASLSRGCCELIGVFGLVLAFLYNYQYFFLFSALGILGVVIHFPRRGHVIAASSKQKSL